MFTYRIPNDVKTKLQALNLVGKLPKRKICARYHMSISSLNRWIRAYDGTNESLANKSHKPHSKHPNAHTDEEIKHIFDLCKRNPGIGLNELYGRLKTKYAYTRHPASLYKFLRKNNIILTPMENIKHPYTPKPYDTPKFVGAKWQLDVKYVPRECRTFNISGMENFYQYTVIDEASRKRFIFAYKEKSAYSTVDFIMRAIIFFGYLPKQIQTDNGAEFTNIANTDKTHHFDQFCLENKIEHKLIKPRTPRHNGKVERSHRNDNIRFYKNLKFYSYDDLQLQMAVYLKRSNNIPSRVLNWMSPNEYEKYLIDNNLTCYRKISKK